MYNDPDYHIAKYRVKVSHFTEQGYFLKGVIHIGAHDGEEMQYYEMMGIKNLIGIEPLPSAVKAFKDNYSEIPIYQLAIGAEDKKVDFYVTGDGRGTGGSQGSSIYKPINEEFAQSYGIKKIITVNMQRFDTFLRSHHLLVENFDTIVIDVQGAELDVLKGFGAWIDYFKYYNIECSLEPTYEGERPAKEIVKFMKEHGFTQDSPIVSHDDVFFVRSDIKPVSDMVYKGLA